MVKELARLASLAPRDLSAAAAVEGAARALSAARCLPPSCGPALVW
jgi:hypothetical protein